LVNIEIKFKDAKTNGPASLIYEWLLVSMILRDDAVASRKARPEIFERLGTPPETTENEDEEIIVG
jgi:hypothetical protein